MNGTCKRNEVSRCEIWDIKSAIPGISEVIKGLCCFLIINKKFCNKFAYNCNSNVDGK